MWEGFKIAEYFFFSVRETSGFLFLCPLCFYYLAPFPDHTLCFHSFFFFTFDYPFLTGKLCPCTFYYTKGSYNLSDPVSNP